MIDVSVSADIYEVGGFSVKLLGSSRKEVISENHGGGVSFRERNELWESSFSKVFEILWVFGEKYEERAQLISFP